MVNPDSPYFLSSELIDVGWPIDWCTDRSNTLNVCLRGYHDTSADSASDSHSSTFDHHREPLSFEKIDCKDNHDPFALRLRFRDDIQARRITFYGQFKRIEMHLNGEYLMNSYSKPFQTNQDDDHEVRHIQMEIRSRWNRTGDRQTPTIDKTIKSYFGESIHWSHDEQSFTSVKSGMELCFTFPGHYRQVKINQISIYLIGSDQPTSSSIGLSPALSPTFSSSSLSLFQSAMSALSIASSKPAAINDNPSNGGLMSLLNLMTQQRPPPPSSPLQSSVLYSSSSDASTQSSASTDLTSLSVLHFDRAICQLVDRFDQIERRLLSIETKLDQFHSCSSESNQ